MIEHPKSRLWKWRVNKERKVKAKKKAAAAWLESFFYIVYEVPQHRTFSPCEIAKIRHRHEYLLHRPSPTKTNPTAHRGPSCLVSVKRGDACMVMVHPPMIWIVEKHRCLSVTGFLKSAFLFLSLQMNGNHQTVPFFLRRRWLWQNAWHIPLSGWMHIFICVCVCNMRSLNFNSTSKRHYNRLNWTMLLN